MSKYHYPNWHEIKDHVSIYYEEEWDDAVVAVWNPEEQRHYKLVFCGSSKPNETRKGEINFIILPYESEEEFNNDLKK